MDICINLSSSRNGEYEPYKSTSHDLGSDVLRGIFKLDANNNLYADGDRKEADGTITRYYGTRAYQEGDESLADAITDGTTTVYKLSKPTTEQGDPFPSPQVCYPDGTEEFVTENGVPVGHNTKYTVNLRAKLEMAPDSPDGDGDYIVRQTNGENTYVPLVIPTELPAAPSGDGTYVLKATVSGGAVTYSWIAE